MGSSSRRTSSRSDRGRWEPPTVESDSEDNPDVPPDRSRRLSGPGPVLRHINDTDPEHELPTARTGIRIDRASVSPSSPRLLSSSPPLLRGASLPSSPAVAAGTTPPPQNSERTPLTPSLRTSFSRDRTSTPVPGGVLSPSDPQIDIPWRLRLRNAHWDYHGPTIINSNTKASPALSDKNTVTEIMATFVSCEALDEQRLDFQRVKKDVGDGRRTKLEPCYIIYDALSWEEVLALYQLSKVLKEWKDRRRRSSVSAHDYRGNIHSGCARDRGRISQSRTDGSNDQTRVSRGSGKREYLAELGISAIAVVGLGMLLAS